MWKLRRGVYGAGDILKLIRILWLMVVLQIPCLAICVVILGRLRSTSHIRMVVISVMGYLHWGSWTDRLFNNESI